MEYQKVATEGVGSLNGKVLDFIRVKHCIQDEAMYPRRWKCDSLVLQRDGVVNGGKE